jgi:NhaP-type Na+/H+ and K+/H+ antiporter
MRELASYATVAGMLMIASILLGRTTNRIGVPALLAFLGLGMMAGEQGIGRIEFADYRLCFNLGTLALVFILFDGGLNTPAKRVREAIAPAAVLATVGVALIAVLTAIGARSFRFSWIQALLLGAILSSTDAAAVFLIIRSSGIQLKKRIGAILELESGLNDPMAFLMTAVLTESLVEHRAITARVALAVPRSLSARAAGSRSAGRDETCCGVCDRARAVFTPCSRSPSHCSRSGCLRLSEVADCSRPMSAAS